MNWEPVVYAWGISWPELIFSCILACYADIHESDRIKTSCVIASTYFLAYSWFQYNGHASYESAFLYALLFDGLLLVALWYKQAPAVAIFAVILFLLYDIAATWSPGILYNHHYLVSYGLQVFFVLSLTVLPWGFRWAQVSLSSRNWRRSLRSLSDSKRSIWAWSSRFFAKTDA